MMVFVAAVWLCNCDDYIFGDEASDVVYVAVRIVSGNTAIEPENMIDAKKIVEHLFQIGTAQAGVALLHFAKEALFGSDEDTLAICVDRSAFEHYALLIKVRYPFGKAQQFCRVFRNPIIVLPIVILCPGVEFPVGDRDVAGGGVANEDGARVACPDPIGRPVVKMQAGEVCARPLQDSLCALFGGSVVDEDMDVLDRRKMPHNICVNPRDGLEFSRPVLRIVRPCNPRRGVPGPLGRHSVAVVSGSAVWFAPHSCPLPGSSRKR